MVEKPTVFPVWAEQDQVDPVSLQNNVLTPPPEKQQYGWSRQFPPRNWFNWLARYTNRWLQWLSQQESQSIVTDGNGVGLFPTDGALVILYAVDSANPTHFIFATGYKQAATNVALNVIDSDTLTLGSATTTGNQPISGGTPSDIIVYGQTKIIP